MTRLMIEAELKRRKWSLRLQLWLHRMRYRMDNLEPEEIGFWFCMGGLFISQIILSAL